MLSEPLKTVNRHIENLQELLKIIENSTLCATTSGKDCPLQTILYRSIPTMTRALDLYRAERRHLAQIELEAGGYEAGNIQNN